MSNKRPVDIDEILADRGLAVLQDHRLAVADIDDPVELREFAQALAGDVGGHLLAARHQVRIVAAGDPLLELEGALGLGQPGDRN